LVVIACTTSSRRSARGVRDLRCRCASR
jgi:hypothetical protein